MTRGQDYKVIPTFTAPVRSDQPGELHALSVQHRVQEQLKGLGLVLRGSTSAHSMDGLLFRMRRAVNITGASAIMRRRDFTVDPRPRSR